MAVPKSTFRNPSSMIGGQIIWGRVIVFGAALVFAFVLGLLIAGNSSDSVTREAYNDAVSQRDKAEEELAQLKQDQQLARSTQPTTTSADESQSEVDPTTGTQSYTVKEGDTWAGISKKFYGDSSLYTLIQEENNLGKNPKLQAGMTLEIPPKPEEASGSTSTTKAKSTTTTTKARSRTSSD